jgi:hypothetical protein
MNLISYIGAYKKLNQLLQEQACFEENFLFDLTVKCLDVNKIFNPFSARGPIYRSLLCLRRMREADI